MVDVLGHMKEKALNEINPHLMTIATLTGHAVMAVGPYTAVMDNGAAKKESFAINLQATGDLYGDMFEVSTIRKEDYEFVKDKSGEFVDVLQVCLIFFFRLFPIISISQKIFSIFFLTLEKIGIDEKVICCHNISN